MDPNLIGALVGAGSLALVFGYIIWDINRDAKDQMNKIRQEIHRHDALFRPSTMSFERQLESIEWHNQAQRYVLRRQGKLPADPEADAAWHAMNKKGV